MSVKGYTITMAKQNVVTKVKDCTAILSEDKSYSLNFRVLDEITCYRRVPGEDETNALGKGRTFSISWKAFLAQSQDVLPENVILENLSCEETAELLKKATIDVDIENFAQGDKYTDAENVEKEHLHSGTSKTFKEITLRKNALTEVLAERTVAKNRENKKNETKDKFDTFFASATAAGVDISSLNISL